MFVRDIKFTSIYLGEKQITLVSAGHRHLTYFVIADTSSRDFDRSCFNHFNFTISSPDVADALHVCSDIFGWSWVDIRVSFVLFYVANDFNRSVAISGLMCCYFAVIRSALEV